jgi:hypothetical protein
LIGVALPYTKQYETGGAHGMYGQEERCIQAAGVENVGERDHLEDLGVDGRIILKGVLKT